MEISDWYARNTYHYSKFNINDLTYLKNQKDIKISLCFPTLNEGQTIGNILHITKQHIYNPGLVDEVVIIDSDSVDNTLDIAKSFGFKVFQHQNILKKYGSFKGKGEALWKSLYVLKGDIILWCDSDIKNFSPKFVYALLGPLIMRDDIHFVKAFYRRPLKIDNTYMKSEGGRVTEILARPILNLFYPELSMMLQPLSGEYAGRREILEAIPFFTGYGVEIGMLIEIYEKFGVECIAQVDIKRRVHRNHPLAALSRMSFQILQAVFKKLEDYNKLELKNKLNLIYNQISYIDNEYMVTPIKLKETERPPISRIKEYMRKKPGVYMEKLASGDDYGKN